MNFAGLSFTELSDLTKKLPAPFMLVDLDQFESNLKQYVAKARSSGKTIRLATKSLRVPWLINHALTLIQDSHANLMKGLMCYSPQEALMLAKLGHDDFLIAYPQVDRPSLEACRDLAIMKKKFSLAIDHLQQIKAIEKFWDAKQWGRFPVCLDIDVSFKWFGLHVGARRSTITNVHLLDEILAILLQKFELFELKAILTYEAQIASLQDNSPFTPLLNPFKKIFRALSIWDVARQRKKIFQALKKRGFNNLLINAGGSGSIDSSSEEGIPTELTVGSGLVQSHIFDYVSGHHSQMAMLFALEVTRLPGKGIITCQSGGFVASGEMGKDKFPLPVFPPNIRYYDLEMAGEVQTPLHGAECESMQIGDRVWFRPSKAGEVAERFSHYYLIRKGKIEDQVPTYRGMGHTFY